MLQSPRRSATAVQPEPLVPPWCSHLARIGLALALVTTVLLLPPSTSDATGTDATGTDARIERGRTLFRIHCANCHGDTARGDGPMVSLLRTPVPDLTLLASHHEGDFPAQQVRHSIDGRFEVPGHGRREMPVWGLSFQQRGRTDDQERQVQDQLTALVEYLRSIQRSAE